jgi:hypothetical protein
MVSSPLPDLCVVDRYVESSTATAEIACEERESARQDCSDPLASRDALLACIDQRFGGVLPPVRVLLARGNYRCYLAVSKFGGRKRDCQKFCVLSPRLIND